MIQKVKKMTIFYKLLLPCFIAGLLLSSKTKDEQTAWIRINQLGYTPGGIKVAIWCSQTEKPVKNFLLIDSVSGKQRFKGDAGRPFGSYGPF